MAYGDSYSAVQSADLAEQAGRQRSLRDSLDFGARGVQTAIQSMEANRREKLLRDQMAQDQARYAAALAQRNSEDIAKQAEADRQFKLQQEYLGIQKDQAVQGSARDRAAALRNGYEFANRGEGDTPEFFTALGVAPEHAAALWEHGQAVRRDYEQQYQNAQDVASTVNNYNALLKREAELTDSIAKGTHILGNIRGANDPHLAEWQAELTAVQSRKKALAPHLQRFNNDKTLERLVTPDPETGDVRVALPPPAWTPSTNVGRPGHRSADMGQVPPGRMPPPSDVPPDMTVPESAGLADFRARIGLAPSLRTPPTAGTGNQAPAPAAVRKTTTVFSPGYFARVRELMATKGMDMDSAIKQARDVEGLE